MATSTKRKKMTMEECVRLAQKLVTQYDAGKIGSAEMRDEIAYLALQFRDGVHKQE